MNTGEFVDAWGSRLDANVFTIIDQCLGSTLNLTGAGVDLTLSTPNSQNLTLNVTGVLTANISIILPLTAGGFYFVKNHTTGNFTLAITTASLANSINLPQGTNNWIVSDGNLVSIASAPSQAFSVVASAASVDLGAQATRNVLISGAATITSFGTVAAFDYPLYCVVFSGAAVLTHNAASLICPGGYNITMEAGAVAWVQAITSSTFRVLSVNRPTGLGPISNQPVPGGFRNLVITVASDTSVTATCDAITLEDTAGIGLRVNTVNLTLSTGASGANGIDTGIVGASTWLAVWTIANLTTGVVAGLLSLSATAPTMPAGFTFKARIGWVRVDVAVKLLRTKQFGRNARYVVGVNPILPTSVGVSMISGATGNVNAPTFTAVALAAFIPTATASSIYLALHIPSSGIGLVAPNNVAAWDSFNTANAPPMTGNTNFVITYDMQVEGANIYAAMTGGSSSVQALGWQDNL